LWVTANGFWKKPVPGYSYPMKRRPAYWKELLDVADHVVSTIREGRLDPYESVNRLIQHMKEVGYSSSSTVSNKFLVLRFLRYSKVGVTVDDAKDMTIRVRRTYSLSSKI